MSEGFNESENRMLFQQNLQKLSVKKKTSEFRRYLKQVFKDSLITGFSQIASSRTWKKAISKAAILIVCFLGFTYQTCVFLQYYLQYPVTVNVEESNPFEMTPPAFTFCNNNILRRQAYCNENRILGCYTYTDKKLFCKKYPRYCYFDLDKTDLRIPFEKYKDIDRGWNYTKKFSTTNEVFDRCDMRLGESTEPCKYDIVPFPKRYNYPAFCTVVNSRLGDPEAKDDIYPKSLYIDISLLTHPEDYFQYEDRVLFYASAHDSRQLVNPFKEGYELFGGLAYEANVAMTQIERLPPPYSTNCFDYVKAWKENNGSGPTTQEECIQYCCLETALSENFCITEHIYISHINKLCPFWLKVVPQTAEDDIIKKCTNRCQPACFERIYEIEYRQLDLLSDCRADTDGNLDENCRVSLIKIEYSFRQFQLKRQIYQPKYNNVELFSYIGGYMGLWLGISLVSIFDLCESLVKVLYLSLKKKTSRRVITNLNGIEAF